MPTAPPRKGMSKDQRSGVRRTVYAFAQLDDVPQLHGLVFFSGKMGEDTRTEGNVFFEIAFGESIAAELELGGLDVGEVGIEDAEGVELSNMVAADLVGANE